MEFEIEDAIQKEILKIKEEEKLKKYIKIEAKKRIKEEKMVKLQDLQKDAGKIYYEYFFFVKNTNSKYMGNNIISKIEIFKDKHKELLENIENDNNFEIKEIDQYLNFISEKIEFVFKDKEKNFPDESFSLSTIQLYILFKKWVIEKYKDECYIPTLAEIKFDLCSEGRLGCQKQKGKWNGIKIK